MEYIFNCLNKLFIFTFTFNNGIELSTKEMFVGLITLVVIVGLFVGLCIFIKKYLIK